MFVRYPELSYSERGNLDLSLNRQRNISNNNSHVGPCVIRPFHFQFRKKMKFYFLSVLFINLSRFFETKLRYFRKNTDILTTKLKILLYLT